jgi:hypothetical protein
MARVERKNHSNKLRIRAVSKTGEPLPRLRVELISTTTRSGDNKKSVAEAVALRSLNTNRDGFAIFSLDSIPAALKDGGNLAVRYAQSPALTFPVERSAAAAGGAYLTHVIAEGPWTEATLAEAGPWHDDGLEPDDVWAIPGIFPDLGDLKFGDDYCGRLVPSDLTVRITNQNQVVRTAKDVITCMRATEVECAGCEGMVTAGTGRDRPIRLHAGELIKYEIRCARLGQTFGDLLYSLPLAPCESVTLAISHWEQRQKARAEQDSVSEEKRNATYFRQNALSEAMSAASSTDHHGWALMAGNSSGSGGSGSGIVGGFLLKATSAFQTTIGASASASYDRAQFASNSTRNFSDRIQQSAEAWRSDHQVVIMEQSESEDQQVSYRTVCNNNHCHVLNIFYHEVLDNFRVTTRMLGHREVYLVPYDVKTFDLHLALCAKTFLLPFLLDQDLYDCYRNLKPASHATAPDAEIVDEFKIDIKIAVADDLWAGSLFLVIKLTDGSVQQVPVPENDHWQGGQSYSYTVNTANFDPKSIHDIGIMKIQSGSGIGMHFLQIESYTISARDKVSGQWVALGSGAAGPSTGTIFSLAPASYDPPAAPEAAADLDCAERLLAHLNCNRTYYNSLLWLLEDPNERFCRFDNITCGATGTSLADLVIPEPIAVLGCYVAFAKAGSDYIPYTGEPIVDERLLTLSTPGIFADAALGQCSACEKIDKDVYWDWKDSPCVCGAKDVTLKTPAETSLIQGGVSPFPGLATGVWATGVAPPSGEAAVANSLVGAFGGALATAMLSGKDSGKEMEALQDLLGKMTVALKDLIPKAGEAPKADEGE